MNGRRQSLLEEQIAAVLESYGVEVTRAPAGPEHDLVGILPTARRPEITVDVRPSSARRHKPSAVVGHDYVSPQLAARYRAANQPYVDTLGNAHLPFEHFLVDVQGRLPEPRAESTELRAHQAFGAAGSRLVLLLLSDPDYGATATVRDFAAATGVSVGTISGTLRDLSSNGFLTDSHAGRRLHNARQLAELWVAIYLTKISPKLREERLHGPEATWWITHSPPSGVVLGGGAALAALGEDIVPEATVLYGDPPWAAARKAGRLTRDAPGNVLLREQFWPDRLTTTTSTAPSLVAYADALASNDPRQITAAREFWRGPHVGALLDRG